MAFPGLVCAGIVVRACTAPPTYCGIACVLLGGLVSGGHMVNCVVSMYGGIMLGSGFAPTCQCSHDMCSRQHAGQVMLAPLCVCALCAFLAGSVMLQF